MHRTLSLSLCYLDRRRWIDMESVLTTVALSRLATHMLLMSGHTAKVCSLKTGTASTWGFTALVTSIHIPYCRRWCPWGNSRYMLDSDCNLLHVVKQESYQQPCSPLIFGVANVVGQSSCSDGRSSTQAVTATLWANTQQPGSVNK